MKNLFFIILILSTATAYTQPGRIAFHNANKTVTAAAKQRIYLNFSNTDLNIGSKWNDVFGSPHAAVVTVANLTDTTGAATGIGFTTIATANWNPYSGTSSANDYNASLNGSFYPAITTSTIYRSTWWNYGTVAPGRYYEAKPQMRLTGLAPVKTYSIYITACELTEPGGFPTKGIFRVTGLTSPAAIEVNGDQTFQATGAVFTLQPTAGGVIDIWCNTSSVNAGSLVTIPALVIVEQ